MSHIPSSRPRRQSGSTLVLVTFFMAALFAFASLSIDVSNVYSLQRKAQSATDAAALAAVALCTNSAVVKATVITEAANIASANGVTAGEISASADTQIKVGRWSFTNQTFTADATPYNAVLVPAKRTVPLFFGGIIGTSQMTPAVRSIAALSYPSQATGMIPFMLKTNYTSVAAGTIFTLLKNDYKVTGNFGKLDTLDSQDWQTEMENGCQCTVTNGQVLGTTPGNAHIDDGFRPIQGQIVTMPLVVDFPNGNGSIQVVGFATVQIVSIAGNGNWTLTLKFINALTGSGSGGPTNSPYARARILVQ